MARDAESARRSSTRRNGSPRLPGIAKLVIQVRASNVPAQSFYKRLGFVECGRLRGQVVIDAVEDDEIVMEFFLAN